MDTSSLRKLLTQALGMLDGKGPEGEDGMELEGEDAGDGGSEGVTDLDDYPKAEPSKMNDKKKRSLDIVAASLKKKMGK